MIKSVRIKSPEERARNNERARLRYRNDVEYRKKCIEQGKKWSKDNPERKKEINAKFSAKGITYPETRKAWWKNNPGKRAKYAENFDPERDRARCAEYRAKNPEKRKETCAKYRAENKEELAAYNSEYSRAHPEVAIRSQNKRRARKKTNGGTLSPGIIEKLFFLQKGKCAYCKTNLRKSGHHLDHIVPLVRRGQNDDKNVQLLCPSCNLKKNTKDPIDFMRSRGCLL